MLVPRRFVTLVLSVWLGLGFAPPAATQELPRPTLANSFIISLEHPVQDSGEVDYIKANFPFGLYAWPSFSRTTIAVTMSWTQALADADAGIAAFKTQIDSIVAAAKAKKVKAHIVLTSGLARSLYVYHDAKVEDVRNAQWYNDNKIASDTQITTATVLDDFVFGTLSRYARKLRANLYAKSTAALAYLKQVIDANPDTLIAVSGWGEAEMNWRRIKQTQLLQDYFCDFSPFTVLEFRDWIQHAGLYDDASGTYSQQGYSGGGSQYQGADGLARFNEAFGTSFATWDLKYFHWTLADDYDAVPQDGTNPDPRRIPLETGYSHGNMMPTSGASYISGGFDPPRTMQPGVPFWELWRLFRETMVKNFTLDMARWTAAAGIPSARWYSHQIGADYLFGTKPSDYPNLNPRYFSSASPLWTADVAPYGSAGSTVYDIKFPGYFVRTTQYILPDIHAMSPNWAAMEYDAETYPVGLGVTQSDTPVILAEYLKLYANRVHMVNFWRWIDVTGEHQIKGMNKEAALREFIGRIRDKARNTNLTVVYTPPKPPPPTGGFSAPDGGNVLQMPALIWSDLTWKWTDWGDLSHFEVFRGDAPDFPADAAHSVGTTASDSFKDTTAPLWRSNYYRVRAVNVSGAKGAASDALLIPASQAGPPYLTLNKTALSFGGRAYESGTPGQSVLIINTGFAGTVLHWTASSNQGWLSVAPSSGTGNGLIVVQPSAVSLGPGVHTGRITVSDPLAEGSPRYVDVSFNVFAPWDDAAPFGSLDSPSAGSTNSGSVPVTGWALDDVGVTKVEIKRDPDASDPPAAVGSDGLVLIGEGVFVAGARPDIELAYPGTPSNDRAGWGYMLLSNFLPGGGNGTYRIYALAFDSAGHRTVLGIRTFICDNAGRTKPFGTIDTPPQGGTASGESYINFGWALTALPDFIPYDGSTITVYVDGKSLGHPSYNHYRPDIAAAFPGLANSDGAVGYKIIDTTPLENGVHIIGWLVYDSGGDGDGIGSRFFNVMNTGSSPLALAVREDPDSYALPGTAPGAVFVETGFDVEPHAERMGPGPDGWIDVRIAPLDRLAVYLRADAEGAAAERRPALGPIDRRLRESFGSSSYAGFLEVGGERRAFPAGSSFDPAAGVFTWQAGPGFRGEFRLVFVERTGGPGTERRLFRLRVTVG